MDTYGNWHSGVSERCWYLRRVKIGNEKTDLGGMFGAPLAHWEDRITIQSDTPVCAEMDIT